jgi:hypothetical protein
METIGGRHMEGFLFFWIAWSGWIYTTFLLNKSNPYRFPLAFSLLVTICSSVIHLSFFDFDFSFVYVYIRILICSMATSTTLFVSLYDPIWYFIEHKFVVSIILCLLSIVLFDTFIERLSAVLIAIIHSDIINAIVMKKLDFEYIIGSLSVLDSLAITLLSISVWSGIEYLQYMFQQKNYSREKEKQL